MMLKTSRAMYRLMQRIASSLEWPWATRRATYSWVLGSSRNRPIAMMCNALFAARSPPRFMRCRVVLPEDAGTGLTPNIKPEIDAFDLSHIHQAVAMNRDGRISGKLYVQFVMGVKNAMPVDRDVFDYYVRTMERLAPDAKWCAAGIWQHQLTLNEWCVANDGLTRTGLEDNVRLDRDTLAPSNAALVRRVVELCEKYERPVANWRQARTILDLTLPETL